MAKRTTKKSASKKTTGKSAKKKTKKPVKAKAASKKTAASKKVSNKKTIKKSMNKKAGTSKSNKEKTMKRKTTSKATPKTEKKKTVAAKSKKKTEEILSEEINPAEARARALEKIKGYGKTDLEHFKNIIIEKREEIIEQLQNLKDQMLDPTTGEYINENSPYSLHMAEQGTDAMEREKTFLYAQRENKFLGYLEDALKRIEAGTYGICIECIDEPQHLCETCPLIPKARLEAVPHSQLCLPIKQRQEKSR